MKKARLALGLDILAKTFAPVSILTGTGASGAKGSLSALVLEAAAKSTSFQSRVPFILSGS